MKTSRWVWAVFGACVVLVLVALTGLTAASLRLARSDEYAQAREAFDENARLALWRMDAATTPLITAEVARPYFAYLAFEPVGRPYTAMLNGISTGDVLSPSPLLTQCGVAATAPAPDGGLHGGAVLLYFQIDPLGRFTSPQVPTGALRGVAESRYTTAARIDAAAHRLDDLAAHVDLSALRLTAQRGTQGPEPAPPAVVRLNSPAQRVPPQKGWSQAQKPVAQEAQQSTAQADDNEFQQRAQAYQNINANAMVSNGIHATTIENPLKLAPDNVRQGLLEACWQGDRLLLVRCVEIQGRQFIQGCWLDWPALRADLEQAVADLLPEVQLEPVRGDPPAAPGRTQATAMESGDRETFRMATLPVRLDPGPIPLGATTWRSESTPLHLALLVAWAAVLGAGLAVGVLLRSALSLSERRAAFVAAVTHELRTPLTTLRMYSEMLVEGMVPEEARRQEYVRTLHVEADRLSHLVENVLAYARLERGSARARHERTTVAALIERFRQRLDQRAAQAGLEFSVELGPDAADATVSTDVTAVEQVLFNLVDNACKHAAACSDKRLILGGQAQGREVTLSVCDHGPGVSPDDVRRLFRPFSRGNGRAALAAPAPPGVGLGLALSRRLARSLGGDLLYKPAPGGGACFVLTLPVGAMLSSS